MKIKFLMDYRGKLTSELYFQKGDVVEDVEGVNAAGLVADGRAVEVKPKVAKATPKTVPVVEEPKRVRKPRAKK